MKKLHFLANSNASDKPPMSADGSKRKGILLTIDSRKGFIIEHDQEDNSKDNDEGNQVFDDMGDQS